MSPLGHPVSVCVMLHLALPGCNSLGERFGIFFGETNVYPVPSDLKPHLTCILGTLCKYVCKVETI